MPNVTGIKEVTGRVYIWLYRASAKNFARLLPMRMLTPPPPFTPSLVVEYDLRNG
jgi:hypothetical protein